MCFLLKTLRCIGLLVELDGKAWLSVEAMPLLPVGEALQVYQLVLVYS